MIKVLHLLGRVSVRNGDFGVVFNYYKHIDRNKVQFDFGYLHETDIDNKQEIENLGGTSFKLTCPSLVRGAKDFKRELRDILNKKEYDIIHLHMPTFHKFVKQVIKDKNVKLIIHSHNIKLSTNKIKVIRNRILLLNVNKKVDARFACSREAGNVVFGRRFLKQDTDCILKNAIDLERFSYKKELRETIRENLKLDSDITTICNVARFNKQKNYEFLIDIFSSMYSVNKKLKLFLFGDGELLELIKDKVKSLNLEEQVVFMGLKKDVNEYLSAMDIFVFPSHFEGLGLSLVEAQANGLICYASTGCPLESKITDNVYYLDLKIGAQQWGEYIQNNLNQNIKRTENVIITNVDYDIDKSAKNLLAKYEQIVNGKIDINE